MIARPRLKHSVWLVNEDEFFICYRAEKEFQIAQQAKRVHVEPFGEADFFIHYFPGDKDERAGWRVSEGITGATLNTSGKSFDTIQEAIDNAQEILDHILSEYSEEKFWLQVDHYIDTFGLSPRYEVENEKDS